MAGDAGGFDGGAERDGTGGIGAATVETADTSISPELIEEERATAAVDDAADPIDVTDLMGRLKQAEADLATARAQLATTKRRAAIDAALDARSAIAKTNQRTQTIAPLLALTYRANV